MADMKELLEEVGSRSRALRAEEVVIRTEDGDIVIKNPEIAVSHILGREVYQIVGDIAAAEKKEEKEGNTAKKQDRRKKREDEAAEPEGDLDEEMEGILRGLKDIMKESE